jgi:UDP-N-acetylmuramyl pentapeptide phosphotransferase/UDP-N-acetylglucosamine-1-phosphate transferase
MSPSGVAPGVFFLDAAGLGAALAGTFAGALIVSACACFAWLRLASHRGLLDQPGGRRVHTQATPRGGGVGIALVMIVVFSGLALLGGSASGLWAGAAGATAVLAAMGLVDDLSPLGAVAKFCAQLLAVIALMAPLGTDWSRGMVWLVPVAMLAVILWINVWNFMDGSHGLVAVQALLLALVLWLLPGQLPEIRVAALALAGACLGFLPFNLPDARVFLGDVGSHALAAAVIALMLLSVRYRTLSLPEVAMLSSVLWVDALVTLCRRTLAGKKLWRAHREHLYQFAVRRGFAPWRVCAAYAFVTALVAIGVIASHDWPAADQARLALVWITALVVGHGLVRRRLLDRPRRVPA